MAPGQAALQRILSMAGNDVTDLGEPTGAASDLDLGARLVLALAQALGGHDGRAEALAHAALAEAMRAQSAPAVCDATSVRALAAANAGDLSAATDLARRASMMSRTEGLREQETLANLVLARVRRLTGRPYLATRILSAVAKFAPDRWRPWLAWELAMSSGLEARELASQSGCEAAACLVRAIQNGERGDRAGLAAEMESARALVRGLPAHLADLRAARGVLDPFADPAELPEAVARWRRGEAGEVPLGLLGLASAVAGHPVLILAAPGTPAVRLLTPAAPLAQSAGASGPSKPQRRQGRTDTALAVLAFAGPQGLAEEELFAAAYGFSFSRHLHAGVLDVLLHRMRAHLEADGEVTRHEGRIAIALRRPTLLVDPRSLGNSDDRVLQLCARRGRLTAKDASNELGIPLRSAQAALEALASSGACRRQRNRRAMEYTVEDTTFEEPTGPSGVS